ncbi:MAG TPA: RsmD family RNA methyltransferase [Geminicoccaceae bacterium]|nr:RsmD family RNA methyltransferase [Geminicoccaceae bacterium]
MAELGDRVEVVVERLGAQGDGIAPLGRARVFVPLALPGERWRVRLAARRGADFAATPVAPLAAAPRPPAPCRHFGVCGGCQLQHLAAADYAAWQRQVVVEALARRGLEGVPVALPERAPPAARRRVRLAFATRSGAVRLGFRVRAGHALVEVEQCPVARPEIVALLPALRGLLAAPALAGRAGEVQITACASGLDVLLTSAGAPGLAEREALAGFATAQDLARLAWRPDGRTPPEPVVARRAAVVEFAGVAVALPPGAFLQATPFAEDAIRHAVADALGPAAGTGAALADLFAGCGTLGLPLAAAGARVLAVDAEPAMLAAAAQAARRAGCGARFHDQVRDLERAPLAGAELARLDAVVLDPPRAGARAQAAALAASPVPRVAMVSCSPASFARDARTLVDGGYRLLRVQPIDAFLWSSQIELVGAFERPGPALPGA